MLSHLHVPHYPLSQYITCLWYQENYQPSYALERALPDGCVELVISLNEMPITVPNHETRAKSLVYGPHTREFLIDTAYPYSLIAVHFKPSGAFPFFGFPLEELRDQIVSLDSIWLSTSGELYEKLMAASTTHERFRVLEAFLLRRLSRSSPIHPAVGYALNVLGSTGYSGKIANVVSAVDLSSRRMSQVFGQQVGMTPKSFQRLQRFRRTLDLISTIEEVDWTEIALICGYFDQAHFAHDFKSFSGMTPSAYHQQSGKRSGHVPIP